MTETNKVSVVYKDCLLLFKLTIKKTQNFLSLNLGDSFDSLGVF